MCGITVILSKKEQNIIQNLLDSLNIIQNRGYDSVGVSIYEEKWNIYKYISGKDKDCIDVLEKSICNKESMIGIGHTRWATHGGITESNAHPHYSNDNTIILVHNGIINNFIELKKFLIGKEYKFYSNTDTEVIANLLQYYLKQENNMESAINFVNNSLQGTWALAIICTLDIETVYLTRQGSPLVIGSNEELTIATSEISGLCGLVNNYIVIDNGDIVKVTKNGFTCNNVYKKINLEKNEITKSPLPYPNWTLKEINEQSISISNAFNNGGRIVNNKVKLGGLLLLEKILLEKKFDNLLLFGCGTSYHACMFAKYYFNNSELNQFSIINYFDASDFSKYDLPKKGATIAIFCSQSGETYDLINSINICKEFNYFTIGVVNCPDTTISRIVDCGVYLNAGKEVAVASTKSFTSTLIILSLIGVFFKNSFKSIKYLDNLRRLPINVEKLLADKTFRWKINDVSRLLLKNIRNVRPSIFMLGREKMYPICKEISLKIKEIAYIHSEGYPSGSLKHGPFAMLSRDNFVILLIDNKNREKLQSCFQEIKARDSNIIIFSDCENIEDEIDLDKKYIVKLPNMEHYEEIIFTVGLQLFCYFLSINQNINPDKPRNLAKVVTVE